MRFFFALSVVFVATLVYSQSVQGKPKDEYPLCQSSNFAIGEVPDFPFTANIEEGLRRIQPDGKSVRGDSVPDSAAGLIVRDGRGRVMIASKITTTQSARGGAREWSETICDPVNGTETTVVKLRLPEGSVGPDADIPNGPDAYIPTDAEGTGFIRDQKGHTTAVFRYWHYAVDGRDNLGPETFEGLPAFRYRLTRTRQERSVREVVNCDQLFLQLAQTTWKRYPDIENEIRLADIHLGEPLPALFDLPPTVRLGGVHR